MDKTKRQRRKPEHSAKRDPRITEKEPGESSTIHPHSADENDRWPFLDSSERSAQSAENVESPTTPAPVEEHVEVKDRSKG
jgi:hypothetical protein